MSWLSTLPTLLVAVAVVLLPGAAVAWFLGFRRSSLLGFAPLFSLSIAGVAAVIAPLVGITLEYLGGRGSHRAGVGRSVRRLPDGVGAQARSCGRTPRQLDRPGRQLPLPSPSAVS